MFPLCTGRRCVPGGASYHTLISVRLHFLPVFPIHRTFFFPLCFPDFSCASPTAIPCPSLGLWAENLCPFPLSYLRLDLVAGSYPCMPLTLLTALDAIGSRGSHIFVPMK